MIFTFDGIKQELKDKLSLLSEWRTTLYYGAYDRILDAVAYILDKFVYLTEIYFRESSWAQATIRDSLIRRCKILDYTPYRTTASSGDIYLSADENFSETYVYTSGSISIPRWTEFTNEAGDVTVFTTEDTVYYQGTSGSIEIPVKQGTPKSYLYVAKGEVDEEIFIYSEKIDNDELELAIVDTDDETVLADVNIVDNLYFVSGTTTYNCEVKNAVDFTNVSFLFGDGITARKLTVGDRVLIKYAETDGANGAIQNTGTITKPKETLINLDDEEITVYTTNTEAIADGTAAEDIESIRENAPNLFQTGYRLGNEDDWVSILEAHPQIHKAIVWTEEDLSDDSSGYNQNIVYGTAISSDGTALTTAQQDDISVNYIKDKKSPTEIFLWQTLETIEVAARVSAKVQTYTFTAIESQIFNALDGVYGILNTNFKIGLNGSNADNIIDDLESVVHHETKYYYIESNIASVTSNRKIKVSYTSTETSVTRDQIYLQPNTVEIWIKRKISGIWYDPIQCGYESSDTIVGMNSYAFSGTSVQHGLNTVTFVLDTIVYNPGTYGVENPTSSDPTGYILYLLYKTQDGDGEQLNSIRLPYFYQITDMSSDLSTYDLYY